MTRVLLVTFALLGATTLSAQSVELLTPGAHLVDASAVQPAVDTFQLLLRQPDGTEQNVSMLIREIRATADVDVPTWTVVQEYHSGGGTDVDTSVIGRADLAPYRYTASVGGQLQRFTFSGRSVRGTVEVPDSATRVVAHDLQDAPFLAVVDVEVIRSLPLAPGFEARIASYNPPWAPPPGPTLVRVTGSDVIATAGGPVEAWVLSYKAAGPATTLWISKVDRRFLRLMVQLDGGPEFWKLPVADLTEWRRTAQRIEAGVFTGL